MIKRAGELTQRGMNIKAVATSEITAKLAMQFGIPLVSIDEVDHIDLDIEGADEIDGSLNAIKGVGGAL